MKLSFLPQAHVWIYRWWWSVTGFRYGRGDGIWRPVGTLPAKQWELNQWNMETLANNYLIFVLFNKGCYLNANLNVNSKNRDITSLARKSTEACMTWYNISGLSWNKWENNQSNKRKLKWGLNLSAKKGFSMIYPYPYDWRSFWAN